MKKSKILAGLSVVILGLFSYSCSEVPVTVEQPPIGQAQQEVTKSYVESLDPPYTVGMKYTYAVSNSATPNLAPEISSTEVLEVIDDSIKVRLTSSTRGTEERAGKIADFSSGLPETGIISEGTEDITVPAGEYKGAIKVSCFVSMGEEGSPKTKTTIWLVKDIGAIKRVDILPNTNIITTELKEFKK
ncbi:hypothetical protein EON78_07480 [bacterium]|nr:MAG: hypothetical protein EON78_07480 [bacterium]